MNYVLEEINALKRATNYWYEWVVHEEDQLNRCLIDDTKTLLKNRLISGYKMLSLIEQDYMARLNAYNAAMEDMQDAV